jgi:secondary thiamine-phosphate synthase enzyme
MPIYNEEITLQSTKLREFFNITSNIKAALEKSGFSSGLIVVSSLHSNSAVFVNDQEPGLLQDLEAWLDQMAPARDDYKHQGRFESASTVHLQALLLNHQAIVAFTNRRLDLGPWQFVMYADLDGQRPKRILVKVIGE